MDPEYDEDDFAPAEGKVEVRGGNALSDFIPADEDEDDDEGYGYAPLMGRRD